jgi:MMP 1-O-methyltransferase
MTIFLNIFDKISSPSMERSREPDLIRLFDLAEQVKGFLEPQEGRRLYDLACEASRSGPCLEIGSFCGKSAIYLGAACNKNGTTLFSIDHHRGSEEHQPGELYFDPELFDPFQFRVDTLRYFRRTLLTADLENTVVPLVASSAIAARHWSTPLSLVFIDGGHAYDTVLNDYLSWNRHILPGGFLIFHDIFPDPADGGQAPYAVYQKALSSGRFQPLPTTGSLGVLRRLE